ncbi:hypothetical protein LBMAG40_00400 [Cyanobium sp.]|jgi:hypothetical protein|nr:hypothetical protein LBMAG40_00400 [Cyanobium sp.]
MYFPFLRARQFELIALRELAIEEATQRVITPILEPVKEAHNNLTLAHKIFLDKDQKAYLIVNPTIGELAGDSDIYLQFLQTLEEGVFMPAFHYRNNAGFIINSIAQFQSSNCMIICQNDTSSEDIQFKRLVEKTEVCSITVSDPNKNRSLHRFLKSLDKDYIRLDDLFEKQARNSDYLDIEGHKFSEEHIYFDVEGFTGYSDYTVLPSEYIDGGSTPRAVAIHITYLKDENQIWIRHFTSNTNDSIANVQGKFAEAAEKAVIFCKENGINNSAITELESYYENQHYPGLGTVKKISIKNHILVLSSYLKNR